MSQESLGLIETIGLAAAIAAADAAVKSANVVLVGYELSKGDGMTVVKLRGDVGAIKAAIAAAEAEAGRVGRVVATRVIARPAADLAKIIDTAETVGAKRPEPSAPKPAEEMPSEEPAPASEAVEPAPSADAAEPAISPVDEPASEEPTAPDVVAPATEPADPVTPQPPQTPRPPRHHRRR